MPYTSQTSDFWGWFLRHNNRIVWGHLQDAGIDTFLSGPNSSTQTFLKLNNVMPAISGGFNRRWGTTTLSNPVISAQPSFVRTFVYSYANDGSSGYGAANTNLFIATDNQNFYTYDDSGAAWTHSVPTNFAGSGEVTACTSRGWFYYTSSLAGTAMRKLNPSYTTAATDSLCGIALPTQLQPLSASPGGGGNSHTNYYADQQLYPSVWSVCGNGYTMFQSPSQGVIYVVINTAGSGQTPGTYSATGTGGGGTGAEIQYQIGSSGTLFHVSVLNSGTGYTSAPTFTIAAGGTPGTVTATIGPLQVAYPYSGQGYLSGDTVTITDPTGSGTGAAGTLVLDSAGRIKGFNITAPGSGYAVANLAINSSTGTGGSIVLYVRQTDRDASGNLKGTGPVSGWDLGGPMSFVAGRRYAVALQNSLTGHTSDVYIANSVVGPKSGTGYEALINASNSSLLIPISSSTNATAGFSGLGVGISIPYQWIGANLVDPQVDTVILLAGADGEGLGTLYEVVTLSLNQIPTIADPNYSHAKFYQTWVTDSLPDSYNSTTTTGSTLLGQDTWMETDSTGTVFGIGLNTPPPTGLKYPVVHQGRLFATDGKTIFYSKSLDEVTTSTGLITSKWEEAWPSDYQLPVSLNNEEILGLKSDGTNLHAGTERCIFTVYGSDPTTFSIPNVLFAQTGVLANDLWSVVYAEGQPSGFVWITQDLKVIHSDFATYREIGTPIYPILQNIDRSKIQQSKVISLTQGPYNLVFLQFWQVGQSYPTLLIWDTRLGRWYQWSFPVADTTGTPICGPAFIYQYPSYTSSAMTPGSKFMFYWVDEKNVGNNVLLNYFDPAATSDRGTAISWNVQTSWQDFQDPTSIKVIDEVELISDDGPLQVSLYGATSQSQFDSGGVLLAQGNSVTGPMAALGTQKFYCAGKSTAAKFYSLAFSSVTPGTSLPVLTSFSMQSYPMARI